MLARLGGDEFVVILSNMDSKRVAEKVATSMLGSLKDPFHIAGNEIFAGVSIGIATYPDDGRTKEDLLKNADTAMYKAKSNGRNNYQFYDQEMSKNLAERMKLESELRKVVEDEELALYYQPKQDTKTGKIVGSEALVRWQHQLHGVVSPDKFIPLAEETGLIKDIGMWVLETACKTLKSWQVHHGYVGTVAVNVSAVQIMDESFVDKVSYCLKKYHLEKGCIELEITESMVLDDVDVMLEKLHQLRRLGISLSIDDFGTGYSSFNYLKQMPVHTLKLDREFIVNIDDDKGDQAVVDGMIVMAHNLGLKVVAEGIETQPQYDFLEKRKCDLIQGYLVSKPLTQEDFENKYVFEAVSAQA
jgi:EAL domain-containing protein (putative c-di-GMP-specific phosphodiesterase class I)